MTSTAPGACPQPEAAGQRPHRDATVTRALHVLWAASVLGGLAQSLAGTAGSLLADEIAGSDAVAGLPQTLLVAGSALAALALSGLTSHRGRRAALSTGAAVALAGCVVVTIAAVYASLPLVLAGSLLLGAGNTTVMLGRYAAADLASPTGRGRAMASVLVATTAGAVAGSNLLAPAGNLAAWFGLPPLGGSYLLAAIGFAAATGTLAIGLRTPDSAVGGIRAPDDAPAAPVVLGRHSVVGLAVLALANLVMVAVMTMAPVQLHHLGSGLGAIGLIVSLHIAGMFAPSPLSGRLTDHIGGQRAALCAATVLITAAGLAAAAARSPAVLAVAMLLLGVGWNLAMIAGSALLTNGVPSRQRPRLEGYGEVGMGIAAAGGGVISGPVMAMGGYGSLALCGAAVATLILPIAWNWSTRRATR
ncbi:MFS transporter [Nonomuraea sp. NPDC026600]|uniref:MFS transporter n=1 Tax=Nonomuraea sp. NPDC026600 TaxID=3155363 RepID=UPI003406AB37